MKKLKSWFFMAALVILLSMIYSGCEKQSSAGTAAPGVNGPIGGWAAMVRAKAKGARITALLASHPATSAAAAMIDEFTALTGIRVDIKILASTEMKTMQRSNSSARTGAFDVYMVDGFTIYEYAKAAYIDNLTGRLGDSIQTPAWYDWDDVLPAYRDGISAVEGQTYSLPIAGESRFFAYRKDLFDKYNKQIPRTLDELLALAEFFNRRENGLYGIAFRGAPGTLVGSAHMSLAYCFTDSPIINQKTGQYTVNSPRTIQSIEYLLRLAKAGPPDIASVNHEDALAIFAQGKAALWFDATALVTNLENSAIPELAENIGYFSVPDGPAGCSGAIAGWGFGIPSDSRQKDSAYAFIMYLSSKEKSKEYNLAGGIPNRISSFNDPEINAKYPANKYIFDSIMAAGNMSRRGITYNYPSVNVLNFMAVIGNQINRAMIGQISAADAANNAQKEIESILAEQEG